MSTPVSLSVVVTVCVVISASAFLSRAFFGDFREGFRILYFWIIPVDVLNNTVNHPESPKKSFGAQIAYVATLVVITFACFVASVLWLRKLLHE